MQMVYGPHQNGFNPEVIGGIDIRMGHILQMILKTSMVKRITLMQVAIW